MRSLISATVAVLALAALPAAAQAQADQPDQAARGVRGLVVTASSWGALELGMTAKQAQRTGMVSRKADHCAPGYQMVRRFRDRGFVVWKGQFPKMAVRQIVITGAKEHTVRGIHIGSTLRQLRNAYPRLSKVYRSGAITGEAQTGDDLYVASVRQPHVGTLNFQFAYGARPKARSKVNLIVVAPRRTVFWGC